MAVYDLVLEGLEDHHVLDDPPKTEEEVGFLAETITDHVVGAVHLSDEQRQAALERWKAREAKSEKTRRWWRH